MKCKAITKDGKKCKLNCIKNGNTCFVHSEKPKDYYCTECKCKAIIDGKCTNHYKYPDVCSICYEEITHRTSDLLECNHLFHKECIDKWFENNYTCPICRYEVEDEKQRYINREVRRNLYYIFYVETFEGE